MAIVPGRWTQETDRALFPPGRIAARCTPDVRAHQGIVHHRKAAVAADDDILCRATQDVAEQLFHLRQAIDATVAPAIDTLGTLIISLAGQGQHGVGQIELFWRGSAAGHIELLASGLKAGDAKTKFGFALRQLGGAQGIQHQGFGWLADLVGTANLQSGRELGPNDRKRGARILAVKRRRLGLKGKETAKYCFIHFYVR